MSDAIPNDILKEARERMLAMTSHSSVRISSVIANAMVAAAEAATKRERERAAKVALERHKAWETCHPDDADFGQVCDDISACADISAAILKGEA